MRFEYFDMLSGDPVLFSGVGHMRSPLLKELCPSGGLGYRMYNFYLSFLSWDKESLLKYDQVMKYKGEKRLHRDGISVFDAITLLDETRELCRGVLSFFIVEELAWEEKSRCFVVLTGEKKDRVVGVINRQNFDDVRNAILQLNYIGLDKNDAPLKHSSEASKALWEKAQKHLKEQAQKQAKAGKPEYHMSNIISKLCAAHPSYNLLNIYDLTVFQLYDAFFQFGYMRSSDLSERIFSNHGGKKFKFEDWLKPIFHNT